MAKYKAYPEYKDSGVEWLGLVPKSWAICRLKNLATIKNGQDYKSVQTDDGYPVMGSGGQFTFASKFMYDKPSVLLGRKGTIDKPLYINEPFWTVDTMYYTELNEGFDAKYLHYLALTIQFSRYSTNTALPSMTQEHLSNYKFSVPKAESERNKITEFLDLETAKIDNLIEKQQQLIELLKEKRQAVISHAVTKGLNPDVPMKDSGIEWLGEVPEHWKICRIKQLSKQISKGTTPSTIGGDFVDEGIRFLKAENIGKSKFVNSLPEFYISNDVDKQISRSQLQERDVLVIIAGATTGMASVLQKEILPANTNQAVSFIRTKNINHADWIYYWLGTDIIQRIIGMGAVQAAQPNLSMEDLGNIPILLPERDELVSICMEIEKQFVQFESLICKAESAIDLMQERSTALISAAVTGKIDVRDWIAPNTQDTEEPQEATA
ncbi:restriction endonuclease subunit S [Enterobacter sp.]|uniref:restriction endonuclease subunit S n=1 Tax=Enterobacter sp. TaxID=42895 RepID=UPI00296F9CC2|nr:restriction endonuclease subunit S [Enterobacter sp.]